MSLYRAKDIEAISDNLNNIVTKSEVRNAILVEPTIEEFNRAKAVILNYIREKKRIIYGGTALNELIILKNPDDKIYGKYSDSDIEFYSPYPIEDIVQLCKILNKNFKYVISRSATHEESFTIFVNFKATCDITYIPNNIYSRFPTVTIDKVKYTDSSIILVDILRQYNDPVNSYWRLKSKTFDRANLLFKHYDLELDQTKYTEPNIKNVEIIKFIFENIKNMQTLVHMGTIANSYYINNKVTLNDSLVCYTIALYTDAKLIYNIILKYISMQKKLDKTNEILTIEEYTPFFQFLDYRIVFKYEKEVIFTLIGNNKICLPYHSICLNNDYNIEREEFGDHLNEQQLEKPIEYNCIRVATFILLFTYHLIMMQYHIINNNNKEKNNEQVILRTLLESRKKYLDKHKITVMDESPYQEFIIGCLGKKYDYARESRLNIQKKIERGVKAMFRFDPNIDKEPENINFSNTSGNKVINPKNLVIKK